MPPCLELTILGSGTSSTLPAIHCLTSPNGCICCRSTVDRSLSPHGWKNARRNTSAMLHVRKPGQEDKFILIDCGKSFYAGALDLFPRKRFRRIDAVLLTHPHADAINGLDDLRSWTLHGAVQKSIDVYCDQATYNAVSRAFPYLATKSLATGGGDTPELAWHIIDSTPFRLFDVLITPFYVEHGTKLVDGQWLPFDCFGFLFDRDILYVSDVSKWPEESYNKVEQQLRISGDPVRPILVLDTLRLSPFSSHYGIGQAVETAVRLNASKTYLVGFAHRVSHEKWSRLCSELSKRRYKRKEGLPDWPQGHQASKTCEQYIRTVEQEDFAMFNEAGLQEVKGWVEESGEGPVFSITPAYDGLTISRDAATDAVVDSQLEDERLHQ